MKVIFFTNSKQLSTRDPKCSIFYKQNQPWSEFEYFSGVYVVGSLMKKMNEWFTFLLYDDANTYFLI